MPKLTLDRAAIAKIAQGVPQTIAALEKIFGDVGGMPSTIEEANALAGQALAVAQVNAAMLSILLDAIDRLDAAPADAAGVEQDDLAPAIAVHMEPDNTVPRAHLGTLSSQNHDAVEVTGGAVDGTTIGATTAAAAKFTTLAASDKITSTVTTGTPPLVITSTTKVDNLHVERATTADAAAALANPTAFPVAATDLPTVIALANALRSAAISKGL